MTRHHVLGLVTCLTLTVGCGKDTGKGGDGGNKDGAAKQRLTAENFRLLQPNATDKATADALFGGKGMPTNVEKPGLLGEVCVWEEGDRKVWVSFRDNKLTGAVKEGF